MRWLVPWRRADHPSKYNVWNPTNNKEHALAWPDRLLPSFLALSFGNFLLAGSIGHGTELYRMPDGAQRGVWRKRESRNSGPESRWPAGDLGREAQVFKVKNSCVLVLMRDFCQVIPRI